MNITILSCSLDPASRSRQLAEASATIITDAGHHAALIDLRKWNGMPAFDNDIAFNDPSYGKIHTAIAAADGVIIASPVYNWGLSSTTKSLIELTGATGEQNRRSAWFDKLVTFVCAGGLPHSYMAYGSVALSLMLDFKCVVNPYLVYATDRDWSPDGRPSEQLSVRLRKTIAVKLDLAGRLQGRAYRSEWEV